MTIDIEKLTEQELRDLHARITERLRLIHQLRTQCTMMNFNVGDRVSFQADGRRIIGTLVRHNRKTVSVIAEDGVRWNVSPGFLSKAEDASSGGRGDERPIKPEPLRPPTVVIQAAGMLMPGGSDAIGRINGR